MKNVRPMHARRRLFAYSILTALTLTLVVPAIALANPGVTPDINGDGVVNLADVGLFASLFFSGAYQAAIDFNCDGVLNLADIGIFAAAL